MCALLLVINRDRYGLTESNRGDLSFQGSVLRGLDCFRLNHELEDGHLTAAFLPLEDVHANAPVFCDKVYFVVADAVAHEHDLFDPGRRENGGNVGVALLVCLLHLDGVVGGQSHNFVAAIVGNRVTILKNSFNLFHLVTSYFFILLLGGLARVGVSGQILRACLYRF